MRFLKIFLPILFMAFLAVASVQVARHLPMPPTGLVGQKYAGFSGVLQIWYPENLSENFGSAAAWVNSVASIFEKNNAGVYIHLTAVPPERLSAAAEAAQPPDMILFSPGDAGAAGLLPISVDAALLPAFRRAGDADGGRYAVPVAAGGYVLAAFGEPPEDLTALPEGSVGLPEGGEMALAALCERYAVQRAAGRTIAAPDIGLTAVATPEPTPAPVMGTSLRAESLRAGTETELYAALLNGEIRALALTERQVSRIRAGQADGKYGDVRLLNAAGYTDRLLFTAIVDTRRADTDARAALCEDFIALLLTGDAQAHLAGRGLFPTAMVDALYAGVSGMEQPEAALRRSDCVVRGAFEPPVSVDFAALISGERSARELMRELRNGRQGLRNFSP